MLIYPQARFNGYGLKLGEVDCNQNPKQHDYIDYYFDDKYQYGEEHVYGWWWITGGSLGDDYPLTSMLYNPKSDKWVIGPDSEAGFWSSCSVQVSCQRSKSCREVQFWFALDWK